MDIHQSVTEKIIAMLEKCTQLNSPRWTVNGGHGIPVNAKTAEPYRGINILVLWSEMAEKGYARSQWLTYNQAAHLGGQVRKGEKSVACVYYKTVSKESSDQNDANAEMYFLAKPFWLFNIAQIDNLPQDIVTANEERKFDAIDDAEKILKQSGAQIFYGFDSAFYAIQKDLICLPQRALYIRRKLLRNCPS